MAGFLEGYGVEEERRARLIHWIVLAVVAILVIGGGLYLGLRTYPARKQVSLFLEYLRKQDYKSAYRLWGCTETSPCREYSFERFMEDWGPNSPHANAAAAEIRKMPARSCGPGVLYTLTTLMAHGLGERGCDCGLGVIHTVNFPQGEEVALWYERKDKTLGFAPWPVCVPQPRAFQ